MTSDIKEFNSNFRELTIKRLTMLYGSTVKDTGFGNGGIQEEIF